MVRSVLVLLLALFMVVTPAFALTARISAAEPTTIVGTLVYRENGLGAAPPSGILLGVLGPTVSGVAMERVLQGLSLVSALSGAEDQGLSKLMDAVNKTVATDLNGILPYSASRETVIAFTLVEKDRGVFELEEGSVDWRTASFGEISADGFSLSDRFEGSGNHSLDLKTDRIALSIDLDDPDLRFTLEVDISYPLPVDGVSRASWPHDIVTLEVREQAGRTTFGGTSFGQTIPRESMGEEPFEVMLYYRYVGSVDELAAYTETWRDATDTQVVVTYRLGEDCQTEIIEPPERDRWTLSDGEGVILERDLKAESLPRVWSEDLTWKLDDLGELEAAFEPDPPRGSEARVWYEGPLPENNSEFGPLKVHPDYGEESSAACENPEPREVTIFFPRDAKNNPGRGMDANVPNWFYYWLQTSAAQGHSAAIHYDPAMSAPGQFRGYTNPELADRIYIGDIFRNSSYLTNPLTGTCVEGIDKFAWVIRHEWQHLLDYWDWWGEDGIDPDRDLDRDFIPDDREADLGFDPNSRDTYGMGLRDGDPDYWDDSEITAYRAQELWPVGSADEEDWADPGKQSGG